MHCTACDVELSDYEATVKYTDGSTVDLCNRCRAYLEDDDVVTVGREDLMHESDSLLIKEVDEYYLDYEVDSDYSDGREM